MTNAPSKLEISLKSPAGNVTLFQTAAFNLVTEINHNCQYFALPPRNLVEFHFYMMHVI